MDIATLDTRQLEARAAQAAQLLSALANERRLLILCQLGGSELSVGELQRRLGLSQSALSQHLALLRGQGILATRRTGQTIWYRIADPGAVKVVATLQDIFCPTE